MIRLITILVLVLCVTQVKVQAQWVQFSELDSLKKVESRPILVFLEADWCTYCKKMKREAFSKKEISELLASKFWSVKLNIEDTSSYQFSGRYFKNSTDSKYHDLAYLFALKRQEPITPTLAILDKENNIRVLKARYLSRKELKKLLNSSY